MEHGLKTLMIYMAALSLALAQTNDIADETERSQTYDETNARSLQSERERLANQRIQAETEIRAREEQRRLEQAERERLANQRIQAETEIRAREEQRRPEEAEQARLRAQQEATSSEEAIVTTSESGSIEKDGSADMSRTLKQLRSLGELKDDGYITEEEFRKIKQKILDSQT